MATKLDSLPKLRVPSAKRKRQSSEPETLPCITARPLETAGTRTKTKTGVVGGTTAKLVHSVATPLPTSPKKKTKTSIVGGTIAGLVSSVTTTLPMIPKKKLKPSTVGGTLVELADSTATPLPTVPKKKTKTADVAARKQQSPVRPSNKAPTLDQYPSTSPLPAPREATNGKIPTDKPALESVQEYLNQAYVWEPPFFFVVDTTLTTLAAVCSIPENDALPLPLGYPAPT